jgi:hypothetical protein
MMSRQELRHLLGVALSLHRNSETIAAQMTAEDGKQQEYKDQCHHNRYSDEEMKKRRFRRDLLPIQRRLQR